MPETTQKQWDSYDGYLFDIDGTLLNCRDAVHYFAFLDALSAAAGKPVTLDGITVHGSTDVRIIHDALTAAGVAEITWRPLLPQILASIAGRVDANRALLQPEVLPAVTRVLNHLRDRGAVLSVATGNLESIAWHKLEACSLKPYFASGSFSGDRELRAEIIRHGVDLLRSQRGPHAAVCVVGDTPADIAAARANHVDVIAVATGIFSFDELADHHPDLCVRSLAELLEP